MVKDYKINLVLEMRLLNMVRDFKIGDKIIRKRDGKLFTYIGTDDSDDDNYGHVKEMLVPVYLPDFEKVEDKQ
ncbi:hypothetical protein BEH_07550 [Priestia filamentosa]|uniref:Uncharacterized protein n=2 Tax=Priestia filamentosa TaxID=1402861 RepID=A0A0H4KEB9_9BACI|nr:hypothetical protein BEH_07550 [Priestia filamentosa]